MKNQYLLSALLVVAAGSVYAEPVTDFSQADQDQDGMLSTDEAKTALPEVTIVDMNEDGQVNVHEAKQALAAMEISTDALDANPEAAIGAAEYRLIVQAIKTSMTGNS